tara:strand:- start:221 stop:1165 length:945 start_codon:yes stop_codon:yes gene_type:complete
MKLDNRIYVVIIATISLYFIFLVISDLGEVYAQLNKMDTNYLPIILLLIPLCWIVLFTRWNLLLKNSNVYVPVKDNLKIYLSGFALSITPGKVGELIKSQLLKNKFGIPREKTAPIVLVEQLYNIIGIIGVSILGLWYFEFGAHIILIAASLLVIILILISSKRLFEKFLTLLSRIKFLSQYTSAFSNSYDVLRKSTRGWVVVYASALSIAFWLIESVIAYFVLLSFGVNHIEFLSVITTYTSSIILGVASFLPLGIGVVEGSLAGFFTLQGVDVSVALTLVIFIRIFTRWIAVSVGFVSLKLSGGFSLNAQSK